jgi:predicted TIM-barrel fold metal-dependent hydrolase
MLTNVIDCHVHLYPPEVNRDPEGWAAAAGEPRWAELCARRRKDGSPVQAFPGVDELLRAMDRAGVERAVLLGWYWARPENCERQNRFYADCVREHSDRLAGCATIHPSAGEPAAISEIRRSADDGLVGLGELSPHSQGFPVGDPVFRAAIALAGELGLPVVLHVTDPEGRAYPGRVETPLGDFESLARALPGTRFVLAHWGALLPLRRPGTAGLGNLFYDTAASPLLYDSTVWARFLGAVGADRVLFGSDYPLNAHPRIGREPDLSRSVGEARRELPGSAGSAVLRENALRIFGRPARGPLGSPA